jgi:hypothetical protein
MPNKRATHMTEKIVGSTKVYGGFDLCYLIALMNFLVILIKELRL